MRGARPVQRLSRRTRSLRAKDDTEARRGHELSPEVSLEPAEHSPMAVYTVE